MSIATSSGTWRCSSKWAPKPKHRCRRHEGGHIHIIFGRLQKHSDVCSDVSANMTTGKNHANLRWRGLPRHYFPGPRRILLRPHQTPCPIPRHIGSNEISGHVALPVIMTFRCRQRAAQLAMLEASENHQKPVVLRGCPHVFCDVLVRYSVLHALVRPRYVNPHVTM